MAELADDPELMDKLKKRARDRLSQMGKSTESQVP